MALPFHDLCFHTTLKISTTHKYYKALKWLLVQVLVIHLLLLCCFILLTVMHEALQESEIILATKQHHETLLNKKKAVKKKKKVNAALNEWTLIVALDSIVLSSDSRSIISIDSKPVDAWNMKYLQGFAHSLKPQDTRMQYVT